MKYLHKLVTKQKYPWKSRRGKLCKVSINNNGERGKSTESNFIRIMAQQIQKMLTGKQ